MYFIQITIEKHLQNFSIMFSRDIYEVNHSETDIHEEHILSKYRCCLAI